jgi:asparagine synthase (glutamine-hydrolysing)
MCGISGVVAVGLQTASIVDQLGLLRHRGPDSFGVFERGLGRVGQTRLAIIDLVTGDPPIATEDGRTGVAFNGEIYNYRELQEQLRASGHTLKTECDTEVIAHLAEDHEPVEVCRQLDGMFAFAVWDERRGRLICGRDRFGKKPLYYWTDSSRIVFGSEIKAVLAHPAVPRRLRVDAVPDYLTFGYVPTPETFFEGIQSLPPAFVLTFEPGRTPVLERYWAPSIPGRGGVSTFDGTYEEAVSEVRRLLCVAVEKRLVADVPLGAFLSGGVDSSSVVALMARLTPQPVRTFTIGFEDEQGFDERPHARAIAKAFSTDHTEFVVNPDKAELVERLVWHHDQPFGDSSALPTYLLSELTKRHVTVALCGDGGDEIFGGYERFAAALAADRFQRLPNTARSTLQGAAVRLPPSVARVASLQRLLARADLPLPDALLGWINYVPAEWRARLLPSDQGSAVSKYRETWRKSEGAGLLDRLLQLNIDTYLLDDLLPKVDRMAMAHGLEVRSPILDAELAAFAMRLPASFKVRGLSLKRVLKSAVGDLLPPAILRRPKRGFGVPLDRWFRTDLRTYVLGTLTSPQARLRQLVDGVAVDRLISEHMGGASHGHSIWTLLTLEVFLVAEGW